eukprot:SAG31_NODE_40_length_31360_cov_6.751575_14_plen_81_part_00
MNARGQHFFFFLKVFGFDTQNVECSAGETGRAIDDDSSSAFCCLLCTGKSREGGGVYFLPQLPYVRESAKYWSYAGHSSH